MNAGNRSFFLRYIRYRWVGWGGLLLLAVLPLGFSGNNYIEGIVFQTLLFAALAVSWNILGGFAGQISFGHAIFFATGAYTTAVCLVKYDVGPWVSMWVGCAISLLISLMLGVPTFRLRGPFFAVATIVLNQLVLILVLHSAFLGGPQGILIPFNASWKNLMFNQVVFYDYLALAYLFLSLGVSYLVVSTKLGYQLRAIREDEDSSRILGVNPLAGKTIALILSAVLTSIGGSIYSVYVQFVDPEAVLSVASVGAMLAMMSLIGGLGTLVGPIIGACVMQPLSIILQNTFGAAYPALNIVLFSFILILSVLFFRNGIVGWLYDRSLIRAIYQASVTAFWDRESKRK